MQKSSAFWLSSLFRVPCSVFHPIDSNTQIDHCLFPRTRRDDRIRRQCLQKRRIGRRAASPPLKSAQSSPCLQPTPGRGIAGACWAGLPRRGEFCRRARPSLETPLHGVKLRGGDGWISSGLVSKHGPTGTSPVRGPSSLKFRTPDPHRPGEALAPPWVFDGPLIWNPEEGVAKGVERSKSRRVKE